MASRKRYAVQRRQRKNLGLDTCKAARQCPSSRCLGSFVPKNTDIGIRQAHRNPDRGRRTFCSSRQSRCRKRKPDNGFCRHNPDRNPHIVGFPQHAHFLAAAAICRRHAGGLGGGSGGIRTYSRSDAGYRYEPDRDAGRFPAALADPVDILIMAGETGDETGIAHLFRQSADYRFGIRAALVHTFAGFTTNCRFLRIFATWRIRRDHLLATAPVCPLSSKTRTFCRLKYHTGQTYQETAPSVLPLSCNRFSDCFHCRRAMAQQLARRYPPMGRYAVRTVVANTKNRHIERNRFQRSIFGCRRRKRRRATVKKCRTAPHPRSPDQTRQTERYPIAGSIHSAGSRTKPPETTFAQHCRQTRKLPRHVRTRYSGRHAEIRPAASSRHARHHAFRRHRPASGAGLETPVSRRSRTVSLCLRYPSEQHDRTGNRP